MKTKKDFFHLNEKEKERAYCFLFVAALILLFFGDQIMMQFIKEEPNANNQFFGETGEKNYQIDFLEPKTLEEINELLNENQTFYILSSRSNCDMCDKFLPTVKELKETYPINIYYINREQVKEEDQSFQEFIKKNTEIQKEFDYTPYLMAFQNGKLTKSWIGKTEKQEIEAYIKENN